MKETLLSHTVEDAKRGEFAFELASAAPPTRTFSDQGLEKATQKNSLDLLLLMLCILFGVIKLEYGAFPIAARSNFPTLLRLSFIFLIFIVARKAGFSRPTSSLAVSTLPSLLALFWSSRRLVSLRVVVVGLTFGGPSRHLSCRRGSLARRLCGIFFFLPPCPICHHFLFRLIVALIVRFLAVKQRFHIL